MADPVVTSHHGIAPKVEDGASVTFTLDGREVTAPAGQFLIAAAEQAGTFIPRFCYHPRMKPVGMCRMCLVDLKGPRGSTLTPACFIPVAEGQEIVTDSPAVKKAQDGVLSLLARRRIGHDLLALGHGDEASGRQGGAAGTRR